MRGLRVVAAKPDGHALPFIEFAFLRANKIDVNANTLADDLLSKEL